MKELQASELRLGSTYNSVKFNTPVKLELSDMVELYNKCNGSELTPDIISEMFEPIPLTEEWLLKCGFYEENSKDRLTIQAWSPGHPSQRFNIDFKDGEILLVSRYQGDTGNNLFMRNIKEVHQLQNLYFALTGKELTIK